MSTSKYLNGNGLSEIWTNTKNYIAAQLLGKSDVGHTHNYAGSSNAGGAASSTLKLETYKQGSTTETYGANYPIFAQWVDGSNVALKCTNYTVCVDKANSVAWGNVSGKPSFATVATSGSYNDLSNKPTIPTVNDATLTIQKNGTTVDTFTANSSTDKTVDITVPTKTSDLTNDSGFITEDTTKIPLAGSNQISGDLIPSTDNSIDIGSSTKNIKMLYAKGITIDGTQFSPSDYIPKSGGAVLTGGVYSNNITSGGVNIFGSTAWFNGAGIVLFGGTNSQAAGVLELIASITQDNGKSMWLYPSGTWTWNGTACQVLSDQRLKQQIAEIDDALLDAWEDVNLVQFKYNDAVKEKSDNARLHTGYVVQQIDKACQSHGVDVSQYGLYCHEEYPQETEEVEVEQADGTKTKETKVIREASEHYSLRYTEVYAVECMYLRRCIAKLTARIEELEKGNNTK